MKPILDLIPNSGLFETPLDNFVQGPLIFDAVYSWAIGDIIIYGHGKGVRLLKDHADFFPQLNGIIVLIYVSRFVADRSGNMDPVDHVVHPVEGTDEGRFSASRGTNKGGDLLIGNIDVQFM